MFVFPSRRQRFDPRLARALYIYFSPKLRKGNYIITFSKFIKLFLRKSLALCEGVIYLCQHVAPSKVVVIYGRPFFFLLGSMQIIHSKQVSWTISRRRVRWSLLFVCIYLDPKSEKIVFMRWLVYNGG